MTSDITDKSSCGSKSGVRRLCSAPFVIIVTMAFSGSLRVLTRSQMSNLETDLLYEKMHLELMDLC